MQNGRFVPPHNVFILKMVTGSSVKLPTSCKTNQAIPIKAIPKSAQVNVWRATWIALGSPPEMRNLNPDQINITSVAINPRPTITEITLPTICSISFKPAGKGSITEVYCGCGIGRPLVMLGKPKI